MLHAEVIRPIPELLRDGAARHGPRTALSDRTGHTSYAELADHTARWAGHLRALGVTDGDVVLLLLPNGVRLVQAYLATVRAHAVAACIAGRRPPCSAPHWNGDGPSAPRSWRCSATRPARCCSSAAA